MKVGLEVHQQLATGKLFCDCPAVLSDQVEATFTRQLRATGGENHAVDASAAFQASRGLVYRYEAVATSCLVELDEEPPHALNAEAVDVALTIAGLVHARPLDEIEVMRKIVVDGSNTAGFQRTALLAVDGRIEVAGRTHAIQSICLEEDAARKVEEAEGTVAYRLDRLGIPLIEIATGPDIASGREAREVAEEIGALLRATGRVRRGIGTIREDLNVSAEGGARVEIKGVQELRLLERYVDAEVERQRVLLEAAASLRARSARVDPGGGVDVGADLAGAGPGFVRDALRRGSTAMALRLEGFAGLLRPPGGAEERLGRELADVARAHGLRGLLHSDELPALGVGGPEVEAIRRRLSASAADAFVLLVAPTRPVAERALRAVAARAQAALAGIPSETRDPLPDGRTRYSRPLPGRDRMYPETDVPPVRIDVDRIARIERALPERPSERRARLAAAHALSPEAVRALARDDELDRFEQLVAQGRPAPLVARLLTHDLPAALEGRDAVAGDRLEDQLGGTLAAVVDGRLAKEGVPAVLRAFLDGAQSLDDAIRATGATALGPDELDAVVARVIAGNAELIRSKGPDAFAGLMGDVMREVRGRRDGKDVADRLRAALAAAVRGSAPA